MTTFNLKLQEHVREKFKNITHKKGITMQTALSAFVESYISDPERYRIRMEVASPEIIL